MSVQPASQQMQPVWDDLLRVLRESGEVPEEIITRAVSIASGGAERIDRALINSGADAWAVTRAMAASLGYDIIDPVSDPPQHRAVSAVPRHLAIRLQALPIRIEEDSLVVAIADPAASARVHEISMAVGMPVKVALTTRHLLEQAMQIAYPSEELADILATVEQSARDGTAEVPAREDYGPQDAPAVRLVSSMLERAFQERASDVHLQPRPGASRVRFRIDGVLHDVAVLPQTAHVAAVARIKALAGMDVSERRIPQDGRIRTTIRTSQIDVRVATLPTPFGEQVVMRLLRAPDQQLSLRRLGMSEAHAQAVLQATERMSGGLVLVCGPTGAGKTTTLYVLLQRCNSPDRAVATVEDPIEYEVPGVTQVSVNPKAGMGFAAALRGILRSDPDVIMVGEIRDLETARLAVEAALTGHTVLSTLHTKTAPGAIDRLIQMGLEPYMVASALSVIVAQRLVRTVCPSCRTEAELPGWAASVLPASAASGVCARGAGCPSCRMTGYRGRTGIFEVMVVSDAIRDAIMARKPEPVTAAIAATEGYEPMIGDADMKVATGVTTPEEVVRAGLVDSADSQAKTSAPAAVMG